MPTYRNNTNMAINYESKGKLYSFPPKTDYPAKIWLPYKELGLELVNADYPPIPERILLSGTFKFEEGMWRRFNLEYSDRYKLKVSVKSGKVKLYLGSTRVGLELSGDYEAQLEWGKAPYLRVLGMQDCSEVQIDAEGME